MILHRFCSEREFTAYMRGETLENHTDHYDGGRGGSTSHGFCFFKGDIHAWARRLNSLVDFDVLITVAVFPTFVRDSVGIYADWSKDDGVSIPPRKRYREYCTDIYDAVDFRLINADRSFARSHRFVSRSVLQQMLNPSK